MDAGVEVGMNFVVEDALKEHMKKTGKPNIVIEVVSADNSDIEITELHVYLADNKRAAFLKAEKRYRGKETEVGEVLLPSFRLQYDETVRFFLKRFLCFKSVGYEGIKI